MKNGSINAVGANCVRPQDKSPGPAGPPSRAQQAAPLQRAGNEMCYQFSDALSAYVDGELSEADIHALQGHLDTCKECSALLEFYREISSAVENSSEPVPDELRLGVMSATRAESEARGEVEGEAESKAENAPPKAKRKITINRHINRRIALTRYMPIAACLVVALLAWGYFGDVFGWRGGQSGGGGSSFDLAALNNMEVASEDGAGGASGMGGADSALEPAPAPNMGGGGLDNLGETEDEAVFDEDANMGAFASDPAEPAMSNTVRGEGNLQSQDDANSPELASAPASDETDAFLNSASGIAFQEAAYNVAMAWLKGDIDELSSYFIEPVDGKLIGLPKGRGDWSDVSDLIFIPQPLHPGYSNNAGAADGVHAAIYGFIRKGEDSYEYLEMGLTETDNGWKVVWFVNQK